MKLLGCSVIGKDGGAESNVDGVMFEIKSLFSIGVLRFKNGSREAFHSHAFNCWSWLIRGVLLEQFFRRLRQRTLQRRHDHDEAHGHPQGVELGHFVRADVPRAVEKDLG